MTREPDEAGDLAERLIAAEPPDPTLRAEHEAALRALRERRLTPTQRAMGWLALPQYVALALGMGYRLATADPPEPRAWVVLQAVGVVALTGLGAWTAWVLVRRGGRVSRGDDRAMAWIAGVGLVALVLALFEVARSLDDPRAALRLAGVATVILVGGAFAALREQSRRQALESRARALALEVKLAELARAVAPGRPPR
jgi:hypothetical protein